MVSGDRNVAIDDMLSSVGIVSPTSNGKDHMIEKGFARFIRKPLSLDTSIVAGCSMLVNINNLPFCPSFDNDEFVGTLALNETEYYGHFSKYSLNGIQMSTLKPGNKISAINLFPGAFYKKSFVVLPSQCKPELATRVKEPARAASAGEMKPINEVALEELFQYTTIAMSDSYFSSEIYPIHHAFYKTPPIGCGTLGVGPMGMLFAAEWIGVVFFSIISQPFYAGSDNHKEALSMFDEMETKSAGQKPFLLSRDFVLTINDQKSGVGRGIIAGEYFIKIIAAPFLLDKQTASTGNFHHQYINIVGEEACGHANWRSNSVFFFHLYKVMNVWHKVWNTESVGDEHLHRNVFVPVELLFGEFSVCLRSPYVGTADASDDSFENENLMKPIVGAVLWLAQTWKLLYIDIRPPNLRHCIQGDISRLMLVDYDDMVLLQDKPCCSYKTVSIMRNNEHTKKIFLRYKNLAKLFDDAGTADICSECEQNR